MNANFPQHEFSENPEAPDAGLADLDARLGRLAGSDIEQVSPLLASRIFDRSVIELRRAATSRLPTATLPLVFPVAITPHAVEQPSRWPMRAAASIALLGALAGAYLARNSVTAPAMIAQQQPTASQPDFEQAWAIVTTALQDETADELEALQTETTSLDSRISSSWSVDDLLLEEGAL